MSRWTKLVAVMFLVVAATVARTAPDAAEVKDKETPRTWRQTHERLAKPVTVVAIEANTPLKEALAYVSEKFGVNIVIDREAFKGEAPEPENLPVKLDRMTDVRLENWLTPLLQQVQGDFFVQPDGIIRVVTKGTVIDHMLAQRVTARFDKKPLDEALRQLSEDTGVTIVLDGRRAGDKAKTAVTADLRHLTLQAALTILADLAELKTVAVDRAIYVTTADNAKEFRGEADR